MIGRERGGLAEKKDSKKMGKLGCQEKFVLFRNVRQDVNIEKQDKVRLAYHCSITMQSHPQGKPASLPPSVDASASALHCRWTFPSMSGVFHCCLAIFS